MIWKEKAISEFVERVGKPAAAIRAAFRKEEVYGDF